jgi:uncharacterized protein
MNERMVSAPDDMVGRAGEWALLCDFAAGGPDHATLAVVWGRRRIGKSFLVSSLAQRLGGFYFEAVRGSAAESLRDLGEALARHQQAAAPYAFAGWEDAIAALLRLGASTAVPVVLDEFPYLLEAAPGLDSLIQRAYSPRGALRTGTRTRLVLCGSAMAVMAQILSGTAALRGRAGLDLQMSPFDFREARVLHGVSDLGLAAALFSVIGGVAAYARDMVGDDLPSSGRDFDRWVRRRVLSPGAPLFSEVTLLLSEDPSTAKARKLNLYHATLAGVASGHHAHSKLTSYVKVSGPSLAPMLDGLVAAGFVDRLVDPLRENRPAYHPADSLIRFHYAIIRRHHARLAAHGADTAALWRELTPTFRSAVLGPAFEAMARHWCSHFASPATLGGSAVHVGPGSVELAGVWHELDVVVAGAGDTPAERPVLALGEAKTGEPITLAHLEHLERARSALGRRASTARLLLFGSRFTRELTQRRTGRSDVELVDLDRLYGGD